MSNKNKNIEKEYIPKMSYETAQEVLEELKTGISILEGNLKLLDWNSFVSTTDATPKTLDKFHAYRANITYELGVLYSKELELMNAIQEYKDTKKITISFELRDFLHTFKYIINSKEISARKAGEIIDFLEKIKIYSSGNKTWTLSENDKKNLKHSKFSKMFTSQKELDNMDTIIDVFIQELKYSIDEYYKNDYIIGIDRHMFEITMRYFKY